MNAHSNIYKKWYDSSTASRDLAGRLDHESRKNMAQSVPYGEFSMKPSFVCGDFVSEIQYWKKLKEFALRDTLIIQNAKPRRLKTWRYQFRLRVRMYAWYPAVVQPLLNIAFREKSYQATLLEVPTKLKNWGLLFWKSPCIYIRKKTLRRIQRLIGKRLLQEEITKIDLLQTCGPFNIYTKIEDIIGGAQNDAPKLYSWPL